MPEANRHGVFISWSKTASAEVAKQLKPFLEDVLGIATIFMSQAMEGGARWAMEIPQHLESCNAGLVLVTRENRHEPWLHFEAGALSKHIEDSRVVPLLCGATIGDIQGTPLSLFQAKSFTHDEFLSVCVAFGLTFGVPEETVRRRFEKSWVELERAVVPITQKSAGPDKQLGLPDLMAVLERVAGQVASIEAGLKLATPAPAGLFGSRLDTLLNPTPEDNWRSLAPYRNRPIQITNSDIDLLVDKYLQMKGAEGPSKDGVATDSEGGKSKSRKPGQ